MLRRTAVSAAAAIATVLIGAHAAAQPTSASDAARERFRDGVRLLESARYADAAAELERSLALQESAAAEYNLAIAYRGMGAHRRVLATLARFERLVADPALRRDAQALARESRAALVHVQLRLRGGPTELTIDGEAVAPREGVMPIELDPGEHAFSARRPGYEPAVRRVALVAGGSIDLALDAAARPRPGTVVVETTDPLARVRVDGRDRGAGRVAIVLPPGRHALEVSRSGQQRVHRTIDVAPGSYASVTLPPGPAGGASWVQWVLVGAGVAAAAAVGLVLWAPWDTGPRGSWDTVQAIGAR